LEIPDLPYLIDTASGLNLDVIQDISIVGKHLNFFAESTMMKGSAKMSTRNVKPIDSVSFTPDPLEDLTIQDAFIISAVYSVHASKDKCKHIGSLAQKHPLFVEEQEQTAARVNKYTILMDNGNSVQAVEAVARDLKPEQRKQAFEFAIEAALVDGALTERKKQTLRTLADKLDLDKEIVNLTLANIPNKTN
jgi:hypothetical protein